MTSLVGCHYLIRYSSLFLSPKWPAAHEISSKTNPETEMSIIQNSRTGNSLAKIKYYRPKPFNFRYEQPVFTFPKRTTTNQKFFFWDVFRTYCSKRSSYIISGGKWIDTLQVLRLESATRRIPTYRIGKTLSVIPVVAIHFITNDVPQTPHISFIGILLK